MKIYGGYFFKKLRRRLVEIFMTKIPPDHEYLEYLEERRQGYIRYYETIARIMAEVDTKPEIVPVFNEPSIIPQPPEVSIWEVLK